MFVNKKQMLTHQIQKSLKKITSFKKVVVGVSGGADSVVLAHALKKLGYEIIVAHLNHHLRGANSNEDEKFVKDLAKEWGVLYAVKQGFVPKEGNLENNARKIRYAFLEDVREKYQADCIAVAHHLDDQIETILMHMVRGSGLRGQIGIKYEKDKLIRPMLDVKRCEVLAYAEENKLDYRTDESNTDLSFNRNFWRHLVIPYLKNKMPDLYEKIREINEKASTRLKNVSKKADDWMKKYIVNASFKKAQFNRLEEHTKVEILIQILGAKDLYGTSLGRLVDFIKFGQSGRKLKVKDKTFFIEHDEILIRDKSSEVTELPKTKITVKGIRWGKITIKSKYGRPLYVRQWQSGDKFQPKGMSGTKTVQNFFVDKKIPKSKRGEIPIIVNEKDDIMAIGDLRLAKGAEELKNYLIFDN
jgi:tRNA(Ile)-lysidine synthase